MATNKNANWYKYRKTSTWYKNWLKRNKERKQNLIAKGLCPACGKAESSVGQMCEPCSILHKAAVQRRRDKLKARHFCVECGQKEALPDKLRCRQCLDRCVKTASKRQKRLRKQGLCVSCGQESGGTVRCEKCNEDLSSVARVKREERKIKGICVYCGKEPALPKRGYCSYCQSYHRELSAKAYKARCEKFLCPACAKRKVSAKGEMCSSCRSRNREVLNTRRNIDRTKVIEHYGDTCFVCREQITDFFRLFPDGPDTQQPEKKLYGVFLYRWLRKNNFPEGYSVYCHRCGVKHSWMLHTFKKLT